MELSNFYDKIKSTDKSLRAYPNEKLMNVSLPARILCLGPSGSGKTNIILNLLKNIGIFDHVVLLAKNLEEPLYKYMIDCYAKVEKKLKLKKKILLAIDNIKDLPKIEDFDPKENSFLLVDDFICENAKSLAVIAEYWVRARKNGVTMAFLAQGYFDVPKLVRKNSNYIMIKKIANPMDLKRILKEYSLGATVDEVTQMYEAALKAGQLTSFFMIDLATNDPKLRFRSGFGNQ